MFDHTFPCWTALFLTACASGVPVSSGSVDSERAKGLTGSYAGELPCADCEGMVVQLVMKPDQTFEEKVTYRGRSEVPFTSLGTYRFISDSTILLEMGGGRNESYVIRPDALQQLDRKGMMIAGDLAQNYMLHKEIFVGSSAPEPRVVQQSMSLSKMTAGVRFYAIGQEPSWSLEFERDTTSADPTRPDRAMRFMSISAPEKMTTPGAPAIRAQDANVVRYAAEVESGSLIVQIIEQPCMDPMSGEAFPYRVLVDRQQGTDASYTRFEGCGRYVPDARLAGHWDLRSMNGISIDAGDFPGEPPFLDFVAGEERVSGSGGCNRMVGGFTAADGGIRFGPLAVTMMACPDMTVEQAMLEALSEKQLGTAFSGQGLTLSHPDGTVLVLERKQR